MKRVILYIKSKFIINSKSIMIKDSYLNNQSNERNLNKYILPYLDLDNCQIKIETIWDKYGKEQNEKNLYPKKLKIQNNPQYKSYNSSDTRNPSFMKGFSCWD